MDFHSDIDLLGKRLSFFRKRKNLTQRQLEECIASARGTISRLEHGYVNPNKETLAKITKVLELNQREVEYLYGLTSRQPGDAETLSAYRIVQEYFASKNTYAYLVDDRWRILKISKGFKIMFNWDSSQIQRLKGISVTKAIVDTTFPLIKVLSPDEYIQLLETYIPYYYAQTNFMFDDPSVISTIDSIKRNPFARRIWNKTIKSYIPRFKEYGQRTFTFIIRKPTEQKIQMRFMREHLFEYPRFEVMEFEIVN